MARYIDADKFAEEICNFPAIDEDSANAVISLLRRQPAADVEEVVRCGQCKNWKINPNNLYGGYCRYCEGASVDHFCSYGERRIHNG